MWKSRLTSQLFLCLHNDFGVHQAVSQSSQVRDRVDVSLNGCLYPIALENRESTLSQRAFLVYVFEVSGLSIHGESQIIWVIQVHHSGASLWLRVENVTMCILTFLLLFPCFGVNPNGTDLREKWMKKAYSGVNI